jgi:hypothetical protein
VATLNGFGPRLLNPAHEAVERRPSSARFRERCDRRNQRGKRDGDDADDDEELGERKTAFA